MRLLHIFQGAMASFVILFGLPGCSTPSKMSSAELEHIGVRNGARYWEAQGNLMQKGYSCYVSGAMRENFSCSRRVGFYPTCSLHITFTVNDKNLVSSLAVGDPICIGTP
jgi:hypothetical protein